MSKLSRMVLLAFCLLATIILITSLTNILDHVRFSAVDLINEPVRADQPATTPPELKPLSEDISPSVYISKYSYDNKDDKKEDKDKKDPDKRAGSGGVEDKDNNPADNKRPQIISPSSPPAPASPETVPSPELKDNPTSGSTKPSSLNFELALVPESPPNPEPISATAPTPILILESDLASSVQPQAPPWDPQLLEPQIATQATITPLAPNLSETSASSILPPPNPDVPLTPGSSQASIVSGSEEAKEKASALIAASPTIQAPSGVMSPLPSAVPEKGNVLAKVGIVIGFFILIIIASVIVSFVQNDSHQ